MGGAWHHRAALIFSHSMRNQVPRIHATERTLAMLEAVLADGRGSRITAIARAIAMPVSTAHRQVATLVAQGYLTPLAGGRHVAGPRLLGFLHGIDEKQVAADVAAPLLDRFARDTGSVVQFGTFENEMVTYRVKSGAGAEVLFTKVGMQLEAYCSAIGKVLLAHLPEAERNAYLSAGPFVALTANTITDPAALSSELVRVRERGFAIDDGEIADDLTCTAVPIRNAAGQVIGALSMSSLGRVDGPPDPAAIAPLLTRVAAEIEGAAFGVVAA